MKSLLGIFIALAVALCMVSLPALSQENDATKPQVVIDKRKLLVQPRNADGTIQVVPFWEDPVLWARDQQQNFYGAMSGALRDMQRTSTVTASLTLMFLSFGYGIFHAAGPGHGKAVISTWLLATENQLRRGIAIAFMSAIFQALTAIAVVTAILLLVASVGATAKSAASVMESASYGLIALMGLYLLATGLKPLARKWQSAPALAVQPATSSAQATHYRDANYSFELATPAPAPHVHGPDCGCGHAHVPAAQDVKGDWSLAKALSLAFAVGIRPCTGALLVLIFANALGLYWAGVASVFVMALGTFITVSIIATIAVYAKKLAMRLAAKDDRWFDWAAITLRLGGGLAIAVFGALLFWASIEGTNLMI